MSCARLLLIRPSPAGMDHRTSQCKIAELSRERWQRSHLCSSIPLPAELSIDHLSLSSKARAQSFPRKYRRALSLSAGHTSVHPSLSPQSPLLLTFFSPPRQKRRAFPVHDLRALCWLRLCAHLSPQGATTATSAGHTTDRPSLPMQGAIPEPSAGDPSLPIHRRTLSCSFASLPCRALQSKNTGAPNPRSPSPLLVAPPLIPFPDRARSQSPLLVTPVLTPPQGTIAEERRRLQRLEMSGLQECRLWSARLLVNAFVLASLGGAGYLLYYVTEVSVQVRHGGGGPHGERQTRGLFVTGALQMRRSYTWHTVERGSNVTEVFAE